MTRPLLFVFWMAVLWGSFVVLVLAWKLITEGGAPALAAVWPHPPQDTWAWINLACGGLAVWCGAWSPRCGSDSGRSEPALS